MVSSVCHLSFLGVVKILTTFLLATNSSSSPSSTPPAGRTATPSSQTSHGTIGGIVGGVVGGIIILAIAACSILFFLRKRRRSPQAEAEGAAAEYKTTAQDEETTLQEMDQNFGRPFELDENAVSKVEMNQVPELQSGRFDQHSTRPSELGVH